MHFPLNLHVGSMTINAHVIFEILAYILGFRYYLYLRNRIKDPISSGDRIWIIIGGGIGALLGSRLVGYFSYPYHPHSLDQFFLFWVSSKSILGGLLGGILGVELTKRLMKIHIYTGDIFVYPIILGMMIGRLGCFSQGVYDGTHGIATNLPWGIDMGDGIPRHPTQLYEVLFLGIWWLVIKRLEPRLTDGSRFKLFIIGYFFYRFLIEFIKPVYVYGFGLSAVQIACLLGFIYLAPVLVRPSRLFKEKKLHG